MNRPEEQTRALTQREERLSSILDSIPECVKVVAADGTLLHINPAGRIIAAPHSADSLVGKCIYEIIAPEDRAAFQAFNERVCSGESEILEFDIITLDGVRRHMESNAVPLPNPDGTLCQIAVTRDVTRRRRAQEALKESEERFRATFHQTAAGMVQADLEGRHQLVNDRYCEITGYSREELIGHRFLEITHPDDIDHNRTVFETLIREKQSSYQIEKRYIRKDGSIVWAQVTVSFMHDAAGVPHSTIASVLDITERKRKESTLRFVAELNAGTQQLIDPNEVMAATAKMLGEHLDTDRCIYAEVEPDENHFHVTGNYVRGVDSTIGRFSFEAFGPAVIAAMRAGEVFVMNDFCADARTGAVSEAFAESNVGAAVCVPLHKEGELVACMAVHQKTPRNWSADDINLVQLVVNRCWDSLERARTIRHLEESEQRLSFVLDSMPQKIFTARPDGEIDYFNPQWSEYTGVPTERLLGSGWTAAIHPDDLEANLAAWRKAVRSGEFFQLEHRILCADGHYRWHVSRAVPMHEQNGQILSWIGSNTDVHDIKSAETAAERRSQQVRDIASLASRLSTAADVRGILDVIPEEARAIVGAHQAVISLTSGGKWEQSISGISLSEKYAAWADYDVRPNGSGIYSLVCATNKPMRLSQAELVAHTGWKGFGDEAERHPPIRGWLAAPLVARNGTNLGLLQLSDKYDGDFTEDDEAIIVQLAQMTSVALENARLVEDLREANRRKDEFLATLAHELRNPLAPMRNMLEIMRHSDGSQASIDNIRTTIERQLLHMVRLIDDLLDVSRISRGKLSLRLEVLQAEPLIRQAIEAARATHKCKTVAFEVSLPAEPVFLQADPARIAQILGNLLDNACKYSRGNGQVWITAMSDGTDLIVEIRDNGIGIPADKLDSIFEMFSQVNQPLERLQEGLGIGLTLVKRLVEMHGGGIEVTSDGENKGSTFTVRLPTTSAPSVPTETPPQQMTPVRSAPRRVLIADDNKDNAMSLATVLQIHGHETFTVHDGQQALDAAEEIRPNVLLLDIGMPKLNGYDVCRRVRARDWGADALIIAVSGWGQQQDRERSKEAGFDYHLVKPVNIDPLITLLSES